VDDHEDITQLPSEFDGRVRLFPLPGLVLFPHAMQPLHIFEPRYCEMLAESLAGDELIAMSTIDPTIPWEPQAGDKPAISPTVCIGRIVSHSDLGDDRHNLLLVGVRRARIRQELETSRSFRTASVEVIDDVYPAGTAAGRLALKGRLLASFGRVIPQNESVQKNLYELMAGQLTLGPITDIISFMMPFQPTEKLELLGISNVDRRAEKLIQYLDAGDIQIDGLSAETSSNAPHADGGKKFPPPFSIN
jgi:uncharacterized protein